MTAGKVETVRIPHNKVGIYEKPARDLLNYYLFHSRGISDDNIRSSLVDNYIEKLKKVSNTKDYLSWIHEIVYSAGSAITSFTDNANNTIWSLVSDLAHHGYAANPSVLQKKKSELSSIKADLERHVKAKPELEALVASAQFTGISSLAGKTGADRATEITAFKTEYNKLKASGLAIPEFERALELFDKNSATIAKTGDAESDRLWAGVTTQLTKGASRTSGLKDAVQDGAAIKQALDTFNAAGNDDLLSLSYYADFVRENGLILSESSLEHYVGGLDKLFTSSEVQIPVSSSSSQASVKAINHVVPDAVRGDINGKATSLGLSGSFVNNEGHIETAALKSALSLDAEKQNEFLTLLKSKDEKAFNELKSAGYIKEADNKFSFVADKINEPDPNGTKPPSGGLSGLPMWGTIVAAIGGLGASIYSFMQLNQLKQQMGTQVSQIPQALIQQLAPVLQQIAQMNADLKKQFMQILGFEETQMALLENLAGVNPQGGTVAARSSHKEEEVSAHADSPDAPPAQDPAAEPNAAQQPPASKDPAQARIDALQQRQKAVQEALKNRKSPQEQSQSTPSSGGSQQQQPPQSQGGMVPLQPGQNPIGAGGLTQGMVPLQPGQSPTTIPFEQNGKPQVTRRHQVEEGADGEVYKIDKQTIDLSDTRRYG